VKGARAILGLLGVVTIAGGGLLLATTQRPDQIFGLLLWLAGGILVHDGIIAPVVVGLALLLRRLGRRLPWAAVGVIQVALVVGGIMTLIVAPEIVAQAKGPVNPTILVGPYGPRLVGLWVVLAIATAGIVALQVARSRRRPVPEPR
jgi:hypothetical protein